MAEIVPTSLGTAESNLQNPLSNKRLFRHSFTTETNGDTWESGLGGTVVEFAVSDASAAVWVFEATHGLFAFVSAGAGISFDLLIWTDT